MSNKRDSCSPSSLCFRDPSLIVIVVLLASSNSLVAEPSKDAALDQEIYALLEAMGSAKIAEQVFDTLAQSFSQMNPNIPKTFWAEMKKAIISKLSIMGSKEATDYLLEFLKD